MSVDIKREISSLAGFRPSEGVSVCLKDKTICIKAANPAIIKLELERLNEFVRAVSSG